ncbi:MAG: hypothetical protein AAGM67_02780, partial [Bacteroidota bacterium]
LLPNYYIGAEGEYYYTASLKMALIETTPPSVKEITIRRHSLEMDGSISKELSVRLKDGDGNLEAIILGKKEIYVFLSTFNRSEYILSVKSIALSSMNEGGERREVLRFPKSKLLIAVFDKFRFQMPPDKSHLLIWYHQEAKLSAKDELISLALFDDKLQALWQETRTATDTNHHFVLNQIRTDRQGNTTMAEGRFVPQTDGLIGIDELRVWVWDQNGKKSLERTISIEKPIMAGINLQLRPNGELICGGLYQEDGETGVQGAFYLRYDAYGELQVEQYSPLQEEITQYFLSPEEHDPSIKKKKSKKRPLEVDNFSHFSIDQMPQMSDGGVLLVIEPQQILTYPFTADIQISLRYYGPLILISLDQSGTMLWQKQIEKEQITFPEGSLPSSDYLASYRMIVTKDQIGFLYSWPDPQKYQREGKIYASMEQFKVELATIDAAGEIARYDILRDKEVGRYVFHGNLHQYSANSLLLRLDEEENHRYVKISFE